MQSVATLTINPAIDCCTAVEEIRPHVKLRGMAAWREPGGGGINVARVIRRLGGQVTAVFPVGGSTGQLLRALVEREKVLSRTVDICGDTREDFTIVEKGSGKDYRFVQPGPTLHEAEWRACLDAIDQLPERPDFIVASGSLPPGVPDDFYARLAHLANTSGMKLVLDTSGPALAAALREGVYLVKPSRRELEELVNEQLADGKALIRASRTLVEKGQAEVVALTLGRGGALMMTRDEACRAPALPIRPVSAVGAGDSFLGSMIWSIAQGMGLAEAFRYGMAAGSAAVCHPGTELCQADDIRGLYGKVTVVEL